MTMNEKIIAWACTQLLSLGYTLKSKLPENVKNTPWSYLVRFETSEGYIYLKHTPALLALEPLIIQILQDEFHGCVADVIALNPELNCFLMKDAGITLREILKEKFDAELVCKAIDQFTSLQLATAEHVEVFFGIGVPDWRLDKLAYLFEEFLLTHKDMLLEDGLSEIDIGKLKGMLPRISSLCKILSDYSIKEGIVQPDFNDNNTLINNNTGTITTIDLGEISISHPFFSLSNILLQMKKHHGLTDKDVRYLQIQDACLQNFLRFDSKENLLRAFEIAQNVWLAYSALAYQKLMNACGKEQLMAFQRGKFSDSMREFIENHKSDY